MARDWTRYQNEIRKLYLIERKSLEEVRRLVKGKYNFQASPRAYRSKLVEWGYRRSDKSGQDLTNQTPQTLLGFENPPPFSPQQELSSQVSTTVNSSAVMSTDITTNSYVPVHFDINTQPGFQATSGNWSLNQEPNTQNQAYFELPSTSRRSAHDSSLKSPLDDQDDQGRTRLHYSVIDDNVDDVRTLLYSGASIDVRDNFGNQPLHLAMACTLNQGPIAQLLLEFGASPDALGKNGKTLLHLSVASIDTLKILLGAHPDLSLSDLLGNTALHDAAFNLDKTSYSFIELLTHGADVNAINAAGESPFHIILEKVDRIERIGEVVLSSLQHGADVHKRNRRNRLPLEILAETMNSKSIPGFYRYSRYGRYGRYDRDWFEEIKLFAAKGASLDVKLASGDYLFSSLIKQGIFRNHKDAGLGMLFCQRSDPHNRGLNGNTALHELMDDYFSLGDTKPLEALLNRGSDPNAENDHGLTPLGLFFKPKRRSEKSKISLEILELLTKAGANPLHKSVSGDLQIYAAARCNCGTSQETWLKLLLASTTMRLEMVGCPEATMRDKEWWQTFVTSLRQAKNGDWPGADARLHEDESFLPEDVSGKIRTSATVVLAENTLMQYKAAISGKRDEEATSDVELPLIGRQVVAILRGCRTNRIQIDQTLYQLLLDFVD